MTPNNIYIKKKKNSQIFFGFFEFSIRGPNKYDFQSQKNFNSINN